jgi:3'(2'), 5'-bisphosphate nucleotidase
MSLEGLLPQVTRLAETAGGAVLAQYNWLASGSTIEVRLKADLSPVTVADMASHQVLAEGLARIEPSYPVLSEEAAALPYDERAQWRRFWLIDPLDGTKEFLSGSREFTVNVALIERGAPVLGVVHAPALAKTYWAARGLGAFVRDGTAGSPHPIHAADYHEAATLKVVLSRSHAGGLTDAFLAALGACECERVGSSLKFCRIAEGTAHLYPRLGATMEWDVAAAHCIVREAGGAVTDLAGQELRYNKPDLHNPFFVVTGAPPFAWQPFLPDEVRRAARC